eukprot:6992994-Alexandrium_andersonii.AAC.1
MSASLVGSEMCIRDRSEAQVVGIFKKGSPSLPSNYRPISLLNVLYKPVSYTHLTLPTICSV